MKKINFVHIFSNFLFLLIYVFPIRFFIEKTGYELDKYIFLLVCFFMYFMILINLKKIDIREIVFLFIIFLMCFFRREIAPLMLIEYLLLFKILKNYSKDFYISTSILVLSLIGVIFYSIIYFGRLKGYLCTGLMEINQSGFLIFFLFLLFYKRNRKIGTILLIFGTITLSRNYLLCLNIFFVLKNKISINLYQHLSFRKLLLISLIFLTLLSYSFDWAYEHGKISESYNDFRKYIYIYDYSNYFRFYTNYNLIELYITYPKKLITGINEDEFISLNLQKARQNGRLYRPILPHNYFFSYSLRLISCNI